MLLFCVTVALCLTICSLHLQQYFFLEIVNTSYAMMEANPNCAVSNPNQGS